MRTRIILLAASAMLAFSPVFAGNGTPEATAKSAAIAADYCGVSADQIFNYMLDNGYVVTCIIPIDGSCNVHVKTTVGKKFIVYIDNGIIGGFDEADF